MNKSDFMPKEAGQQILTFVWIFETAPTLTLAAKAQKLLFSLYYLGPWMAVSWYKSCTRLCVIPSHIDVSPVANHPRIRKSKSLWAKYSRQKKKNWLIRVKRIHFNPCWGWFNSSQMLVEIMVGLELTDLWRIINNNKYETYPANIQ